MTALTIDLPEDACRRLRELANLRGVSLDRLFQQPGAAARAASDVARATETRDRQDRAEAAVS